MTQEKQAKANTALFHLFQQIKFNLKLGWQVWWPLAFTVTLNILLQIHLKWTCMHAKDLWTPNSLVNKTKFVCGNRGRQSHRVYLKEDHLSSTEHSTSWQHACLQTNPEWLCKRGPFYCTDYLLAAAAATVCPSVFTSVSTEIHDW